MRYVGLLRNVMIGREGLHRAVLLELASQAGARAAVSLLSTGNLAFDAEPGQLAAVVRRLEGGIERVIGRPEPVVVRAAAQIRDLVAADPFAGFPAEEWERSVAFLPLEAPPLDAGDLRAAENTTVVAVRPQELLVASRHGVRRPGPLRVLEESTGRRGTSRAWSTVERLAARA
jgi:uncharacterized protein (DUF1697 family)